LWYAASLVPEISDDVYSVDVAMKLGYNWKYGPFELMDTWGAPWLCEYFASQEMEVPARLKKVGTDKFYRVENGQLQYFGVDGGYHDVTRPNGQLLLSDIKRRSKPLLKNGSASLWDVGDGVAC